MEKKVFIPFERWDEVFDEDGKLKNGFIFEFKCDLHGYTELIDCYWTKAVSSVSCIHKNPTNRCYFAREISVIDVEIYQIIQLEMEEFSIEKYEMLDHSGKRIYKPVLRDGTEVLEVTWFKNTQAFELSSSPIRIGYMGENGKFVEGGRAANGLYFLGSESDLMLIKVN